MPVGVCEGLREASFEVVLSKRIACAPSRLPVVRMNNLEDTILLLRSLSLWGYYSIFLCWRNDEPLVGEVLCQHSDTARQRVNDLQ